jgi:hypothetical protein
MPSTFDVDGEFHISDTGEIWRDSLVSLNMIEKCQSKIIGKYSVSFDPFRICGWFERSVVIEFDIIL